MHLVSQPPYFVQDMAYVDHRQPAFIADALQKRE